MQSNFTLASLIRRILSPIGIIAIIAIIILTVIINDIIDMDAVALMPNEAVTAPLVLEANALQLLDTVDLGSRSELPLHLEDLLG